MRFLEAVNIPDNLTYVARKASASPATGFKKVHDKEQASIVSRAFGEE
jgi:2-oxoglutarate dehydrogenase E1 component